MIIKPIKNNSTKQNQLWQYQILQYLGKGEHGQVYKVYLKKNNKIYIIKKINIYKKNQKQNIDKFRSIQLLKFLQHPSIISYHDCFMSIDCIFVVCKFAQKGNLSTEIELRKKNNKKYTQQQLLNIFFNLVQGLRYLHQNNIIHRNIKPHNIFITKSGKYKIGDLNLAKKIYHPSQSPSNVEGTSIYHAPQIILKQVYSFPVDIWALGCVFYFMASFQHPFKDLATQTTLSSIINKSPKPINGTYSSQLIQIINNLLQKNPNIRPTIQKVHNKLKQKIQSLNQIKTSIKNFRQLLVLKEGFIDFQYTPKKKQYHNKLQQYLLYSVRDHNSKRKLCYESTKTSRHNPQKTHDEISSRQKKRAHSVLLVKKVVPSTKSSQKLTVQQSSPMIKSTGFSFVTLKTNQQDKQKFVHKNRCLYSAQHRSVANQDQKCRQHSQLQINNQTIR